MEVVENVEKQYSTGYNLVHVTCEYRIAIMCGFRRSVVWDIDY